MSAACCQGDQVITDKCQEFKPAKKFYDDAEND